MHNLASRYPVQWIDRWALRNGKSVTVRPVLPQDLQMESDFIAQGLTAHSRYQRFQTSMRELPPALARYFTEVDYHDHFALVAESFDNGAQVQVGDARFVRDGAQHDVAEFAIAVADAWQGLGLGRRLMRSTVAAARDNGVNELYGDVLRTNASMLALAHAEGFTSRRHPHEARLLRVAHRLDVEAVSTDTPAETRLAA